MLFSMDGGNMILDCPEGTTRRLLESDVDVRDVSHVFISHGHLDHLAGIAGFIWQNWIAAGREGPVEILAAPYVLERVRGLLELGSTPPGVIRFPVIETPLNVDGPASPVALGVPFPPRGACVVRFTHARGVHDPEPRALRVDVSRGGARRFSFCYSADTAPCEAIVALASGCDLLIHEATFLDEEEPRATRFNHSTPSGAASVATRAGVKELALVHYSNTLEGREDELQRQASLSFPGKVIVARDGLVLSGEA